jgi:hypothetical protein
MPKEKNATLWLMRSKPGFSMASEHASHALLYRERLKNAEHKVRTIGFERNGGVWSKKRERSVVGVSMPQASVPV